jgi:hypothetical protein
MCSITAIWGSNGNYIKADVIKCEQKPHLNNFASVAKPAFTKEYDTKGKEVKRVEPEKSFIQKHVNV